MGIIKVLNQKTNTILKNKLVHNKPRKQFINLNRIDKTPPTDTVELTVNKDTLKKIKDIAPKTTNYSNEAINVSTLSDGKYYNICVNKGKNVASSSCHIDTYFDDEVIFPKEYTNNDGNITGLYVTNVVSTGGGMGTEAMKQTVLLSQKLGQKGKVFLEAAILDKTKGSPVPFYTKLGFLPVDKSLTQEIQKGMESLANTGKYTGPTTAVMYLPLDRVNSLLAK